MACSELKNYVQKRDGRLENVDLKKIKTRIEKQCYGLDRRFINRETIANKINNGLSPGITTNEIDELTAETIAMMTTAHSDFAILAGRIAVSQLYKTTKDRFSDVIEDLYNVTDTIYFNSKPKIDKKYYEIVKKHSNRLDDSIKYERDFTLTYFGYKTLEKSYLLRIHGRIVERPQQLLMRVAIGIHGDDIDSVIETYDLMSMKYFTHASPTLFTAATPKAQLSSCFLLTIPEDSVEGIFHCLSQSASIIKYGGGLGVNVHKVRAKGSQIGGDNGQARGIVPMLRVFNNVAKYIDQGANKRPGAIAIYLEPWHADIIDFLNLKKNTGKEEYRARDLFYGLWIPDLFMKRVKDDSYWSLMCPNQSPGLSDCWGDEFERLYEKYENDGRFIERVQARDVFRAIITSQIETGTPYMLYKDACNRKSNQQNLGTIKSSNLCTEIIEYTSADEIAVCNLASIALNMFVLPDKSGYDFNKLKEITKIVTRNLNKIIDINYYPLPETRNSNERHRPIGIGVQGLADTFILLRLPFESQKAQLLNKQIFETIYYAALEASCELAEINGPYSSYSNSPVSKNVLQFDMWGIIPTDLWDWSVLRQRISNFGIRNSLLIAPMPTASTAQILGNNESTEPYTSNIYTRRVLSGEFQIVNHHLVKDLTDLGLWDDLMKNQIIANYGSIQNIPNIPDELKRIYKTVWEVSQKVIIDMAADRGPFIDQSQSMNIHLATPTFSQMVSMHFYGWEKGLKTGMYYLRTKPAAHPIQFTVDKSKLLTKTNGIDSESVCSLQKPGECDMCSA